MADAQEMGPLRHISAEAIGQPGQRRFRLCALNGDGDSASLWIEKEQLSALGEAVENVLRDEGYQYQRLPLDDLEPDPAFPLSVQTELRAGQISLGINRERQRIVVISAESADPDQPGTTLSFEFDYRRGYELRRQIAQVVAAGRPACPLCTAPMDPDGHVCVRGNGHHPD
jgi:uncharacterized repeat protein (TIGR03847 family)